MSKRFKGKTCAYCATPGISTDGDHVLARQFFFVEDRGDLPQVPACKTCNNEKSKLEHYVTSVLPIASRLPNAERYRKEMVRPRLAKNSRLSSEMGLDKPPQLVNFNGIIQPMHPLSIKADAFDGLMKFIARGLYAFHFGGELEADAQIDAYMIHPEGEVDVAVALAQIFPAHSHAVEANLGNGTFVYDGRRHPVYGTFSTWKFVFYGGVALHGADGAGANYWRVNTRPSERSLAATCI